jgi:hypothetical protein
MMTGLTLMPLLAGVVAVPFFTNTTAVPLSFFACVVEPFLAAQSSKLTAAIH